MEDFDAPAQRFGKRRCADGHHHELLEVHIVVGVGAAVEDVHHGDREQVRGGSSQIAVEGQAVFGRGGAGGGHGDRENRVGAQSPFIWRAVEFDHLLIDGALVGGIEVGERIGDLAYSRFRRL